MRLPSPLHADTMVLCPSLNYLPESGGFFRRPREAPVSRHVFHVSWLLNYSISRFLDMVRHRTQPSPVQPLQLKSCGGATRTNTRHRAGFAERRGTKRGCQFCLGLIEQDGIN